MMPTKMAQIMMQMTIVLVLVTVLWVPVLSYYCYSGGDCHRAAAALVMVIEAAAGAAGGWRWWQRWRPE